MTITKDDITGTEVSTKWQTQDGRKVRIYAVDDDVVHGAVHIEDEHYWSVCDWTVDGRSGGVFGDEYLVPIPEKYEPLVGYLLVDHRSTIVRVDYYDHEPPLLEDGLEIIPVREYDPDEEVLYENVHLKYDDCLNSLVEWGRNSTPCWVKITVTKVKEDKDG